MRTHVHVESDGVRGAAVSVEGSCRRELLSVAVGREIERELLSAYHRVRKVDSVVQSVSVGGIDADEFLPFAQLHFFDDAQHPSPPLLTFGAGGVDHHHVRQGAAVENRHFEVVEFRHRVVDASAH